ncbi:MAG: PrsW family glutamic-type intramembrane protease [Candidatus Poseidoniaceae archaeon]|nr:PrsW family glutamic-type intramembrane protease [Candidatus Poseidoniaceae archaeon]
MQGQQIPLTPPPPGLALASASSPWKTIWSMLGIVILLYIISQFVTAIFFGIWLGSGTLTMFSSICLVPLLLVYMFTRRPKLTHVLVATPNPQGQRQHQISGNRILTTIQPTRFQHHLVRDSPPLEMPRTMTLWGVFFLTVTISVLCFLPLAFSDSIWVILLALFVAIPAWLFGFSLPVHAWWAFSTRHLQLMTTRREGEMMLIAGMLSTIPAIIINSLIFPEIVLGDALETIDPGSIGELLLLAVSAPVGEELSKAALVLALHRIIDSPRRGFQVGFSVGLGFALLENLQYILGSLLGGEAMAFSYGLTTVVRGIGSIPGHAFWTALSGTAIGWHLSRKRGVGLNTAKTEVSNWMIFDSSSGQIMRHQENVSLMQVKIRNWLYKPFDRVWKLPMSPLLGIALAISGHSFWNGSFWLVAKLTEDSDIVVQIVVSLIWMVVLVLGLWFIARQILASVMHLPAR